MSRRPSRSNLTVSLFPFLAVLVCAMGALIFLLIVTTQMIGDESAQKKKVVEVKAPEPTPTPNPFIEVAPYESPDRETLDAAPEFVVVLPKVEPPPEPKPIPPLITVPDPNIKLRRQIADLKIQQERRRQQLAEQSAELLAAQRALDAARQDLKQQQAALDKLQTDQSRVGDESQEIQAERKRLLLKIRKTEEKLEELENRRATSPSKYALIPYDGRQGTTRRPIFVECTKKGIRFLPENVFLGPSQLEGFTDGYNPLLAGVRALNDHWTRLANAPNALNAEEPYVMLIVRPEGSVTYYMARKFLTEWQEPYGYELIEEDFAWELPAADPQAQQVLRQAIAESLKNRSDVIRKYAVRGSMDALSEFPDEEEMADPELPFSQGTSNASRFAAKARRHRRRIAEQGNASGGRGSASRGTQGPRTQGRGPGGRRLQPTQPKQNPQSSLPGWDEVPSQYGQNGSKNPGGHQIPATRAPAEDPTDAFEHAGEIPRRFLSPSDAQALEPGWSRGAANEDQAASLAGLGPKGSNPQASGRTQSPGGNPQSSGGNRQPSDSDNGTSPLFDDLDPTQAGTRNPLEQNLSGNNSGQTGSTEQGGQPGSPPQTSTEANARGPQSPSSDGKPGRGQAGPQAHPTGNELAKAPYVGRSTGSPGQNSAPKSPQAGGTSSPSAIGQQGQPTLPQLTLNRQQQMDRMQKNLSKRGWGLSRRAGIGIERSVNVVVTPDRIQVGKLEMAIVLGHGETEQQVVRAVIVDIDENAKTWGDPPSGFYWVPYVRFRVSSQAVHISKPIEQALRKGGLSTKTTYGEAAAVGTKQEVSR
ncbi:hypothetical protein CA54_12690 [Symmachiella macrocystis]|uniref:Uncharacterized protein n=1 Tax=Symmachiella macrocystis TaxID=2527985 RepID=A0A5C6BKD1_9PLAN|nr:hypothetical protein [Symmachiella macrocystis]TWU12445.1 hypothetical protein CA54_12690 [Symmachiella macrocystis]